MATSINSLPENACTTPPLRIVVDDFASGSQFAETDPLKTRPSSSIPTIASAPVNSRASSGPCCTARPIRPWPKPAHSMRITPSITAPAGKPPPGE